MQPSSPGKPKHWICTFLGPTTMPAPVEMDDLICAMRDLTLDDAQTTQVPQQLVELPLDPPNMETPLVMTPGIPSQTAGGPVPMPELVKNRLRIRVDPGITELAWVTDITLGLQTGLYSRFGGDRLATEKELLESGSAVEVILKAEANQPVLEPDPTPENEMAEEIQKSEAAETEPKTRRLNRSSPAATPKAETSSLGGEHVAIRNKQTLCSQCQKVGPTTCDCRGKELPPRAATDHPQLKEEEEHGWYDFKEQGLSYHEVLLNVTQAGLLPENKIHLPGYGVKHDLKNLDSDNRPIMRKWATVGAHIWTVKLHNKVGGRKPRRRREMRTLPGLNEATYFETQPVKRFNTENLWRKRKGRQRKHLFDVNPSFYRIFKCGTRKLPSRPSAWPEKQITDVEVRQPESSLNEIDSLTMASVPTTHAHEDFGNEGDKIAQGDPFNPEVIVHLYSNQAYKLYWLCFALEQMYICLPVCSWVDPESEWKSVTQGPRQSQI